MKCVPLSLLCTLVVSSSIVNAEEHKCSGEGERAKKCLPTNDDREEGSLLQISGMLSPKKVSKMKSRGGETRNSATDARFLITSTFGPTRASVSELSATSHQQWVQNQMDLPVESHRAYYRQRVNPKYTFSAAAGVHRTQCDQGARWTQLVFSREDIGLTYEVHGYSSLSIGGVFRTNIGTGDLRCRLGNFPNIKGRICKVTEEWNGEVLLSDDTRSCHRASRWVSNVPLNVSSESDVKSTSLQFTSGKYGELVVLTDLEQCDVTRISVIEVDGKFYRYQDRFGLMQNTPENPSVELDKCVSRNAVNAESCRAVAASNVTEFVPGWTENLYIGGWGEYRGKLGYNPDASSIVGSLSYPRDLVAGYSLRWTGYISIVNSGEYWFATSSDDGTELSVDGVKVVNNGGFHPAQMREGSVTLTVGLHEIIIDFFQGGGGVFIAAEYKGGDTADVYIALDSAVVSTGKTPCAVACGSPGEEANGPVHAFTILGSSWDGWSPQQVENKYKQMSPWLSKSTVWTMVALEAGDQLRQRVAWALSQIFVVSASDSSDYGKTEMWLNYYDIFVRNAFGSFKDMLREVVYSPVMGMYRQHSGSSSYEYGSTYPKEKFAQDLLELFAVGHFSLKDVLNVARVLTGFTTSPAKNSRGEYHKSNMIDPMYIDSDAHDKFPKPDLQGHFLGDGRPLCEDLPTNGFLAAGAQFEYVGGRTGSDVLTLRNDSALGQVLCGGSTASCEPSFRRTLTETVACVGDECGASLVVEVNVGGFHFLYLRPVCVQLFFEDGDTVVINDVGEVQQNDGAVFQVSWADVSPPAAGSYNATVTTAPMFDYVPSSWDVENQLAITTEAPSSTCSVCDGDVKAYGVEGAFTIFEVGGTFYRNIKSNVGLQGVVNTFRNPPVFVKGTMNKVLQSRAIEAEVEALLDHLVSHRSTPASFGRKLIQQLTVSNPSVTYLENVAYAFETGSYDGISYSGSHGDLAATVAAVILHPEASGTTGALREPMLKIIHFMRAMGYQDAAAQPIVFKDQQDTIGQFPFGATTASRYFDPGHLVGYLNVITSLISSGVSHKCNGDTAVGVSVTSWDATRELCPQGELTFRGSGNSSEVVDQLDALLTGGRLGAATKAAVLDVYLASGGPVDNVKAAQQAIAMTAEFNTLGDTDVIPNGATVSLSKKSKRMTKNVRAYKAAILLFMEGGADTFNMIVPLDPSLYEQYTFVRQDLAKQTSELLAISTTGQSGTSFGVHSKLDFLKSLYDLGQAAFVANIGSLVEPTTKASFSDGSAQTCIGPFSHEAQTSAVQTLQCQVSATEAHGAGGRLADALSGNFTTATFSMSGLETWPEGVFAPYVAIDENHKRLEYFERWRHHIQRFTSAEYSNTMAEAFSQRLLESVQNAEIQEHAFSEVTSSTNYNTDDSLRKQFYDVARLISARVHRGAERDLFFVRIGGFDHHDNAKKGLNALFNAIDTALEGFVAEMEAQEMWNSVVILSTSEFGRTLTSSKDGSDHGWAGNHFIVGGDVSGGKILNQYPATLVDNDRDLGRGRLIPEYPWESVMAPVAEWMGLETSQRHTVFPNIVNFPSDNLVSYNSLFSQ